ncbi:hypothetical protein AWH48_09250 [Domibacillus aminovorans]|uniref:Uncharacterized protein n=1 Tax=Domibacillus aminovorans TaxID=29332 RepID=A0A177KMV7_9BACI|nr:hypothetical protein [Domibacillus aminovorans]OAH54758.1 hypothetical protein AWH48_09250 [Domibacillus aminovorans]
MKKNKLVNYVMTGALSLGVLGAAGLPALAASDTTAGSATQEKVETIMDTLRTKLTDLGVDLPEKGAKGNLFAGLDDETKAKAEAIMEQKKAGTITEDEAKTQLKALGVTFSERGEKGDPFANLDDETKAKAGVIMEKQRAGTITHDEAEEQLAALGVERPERGGHGDPFANLDDETKAKAEAIMEKQRAGTITHDEAEEQLAALGVERPERGGKGGQETMLEGLDDKTKAEAEALLKEAKEDLSELGVDKVPFH